MDAPTVDRLDLLHEVMREVHRFAGVQDSMNDKGWYASWTQMWRYLIVFVCKKDGTRRALVFVWHDNRWRLSSEVEEDWRS